jgi:hypothetical protein
LLQIEDDEESAPSPRREGLVGPAGMPGPIFFLSDEPRRPVKALQVGFSYLRHTHCGWRPAQSQRGTNTVALSPNLHSVDLTYHCPHCSHPLVMPGIWFKSAWRFKCKSCKSTVPLTYSSKLALFGRHREPMHRAEVSLDGGKDRIGSPSVTPLATIVGQSPSSRNASAARPDGARVANIPPRIIFGDKRFQKGT